MFMSPSVHPPGTLVVPNNAPEYSQIAHGMEMRGDDQRPPMFHSSQTSLLTELTCRLATSNSVGQIRGPPLTYLLGAGPNHGCKQSFIGTGQRAKGQVL